MKISEFFEYNNQQVLEENENILEYLEQIFGKSTEIDREGKKEFTFGKVIGLVTDSFLDEKTKRQKKKSYLIVELRHYLCSSLMRLLSIVCMTRLVKNC